MSDQLTNGHLRVRLLAFDGDGVSRVNRSMTRRQVRDVLVRSLATKPDDAIVTGRELQHAEKDGLL